MKGIIVMKIKSLALMLSCVLLFGCVCGCDTITDTTGDDTAVSDNDTTNTTISSDDDTETTITTQVKKTTTTKKKTTTTKITTTTQPKPTEQMVWISSSGTKYHSKFSCSNMKNPSQVSKSRAIELGLSPCKKCY